MKRDQPSTPDRDAAPGQSSRDDDALVLAKALDDTTCPECRGFRCHNITCGIYAITKRVREGTPVSERGRNTEKMIRSLAVEWDKRRGEGGEFWDGYTSFAKELLKRLAERNNGS